MADTDPTGSGTVAAQIPEAHRELLLTAIDAARDSLVGELADELHADPERAELETAALARLAALVGGEAIPVDDGMLATVRELAISVDRLNRYEQAAHEHSVFWGAVEQLEQVAGRAA